MVQEGARADLILVDDNPLEQLSFVDPQVNVDLIMKDGRIFKNVLG